MSKAGESNPIDLMSARLTEIEAETARHQQTLDKLTAEANEIKMALRVLRRYGVEVAPVSEKAPHAARSDVERPTMPEMISGVVSELSFLDGATSKDILDGIRRNWLPDITPDKVRPTIWRMEKAGRLVKKGDRYDLPENSEGAEAEASEPSESTGEAPTSPNERKGESLF